MKNVFSAASRHGLKVYVTALNGNDMATAVGTPVQSYFANPLNNHSEREAFQNKVLDPLLTALNALNANRDVVYGLDLINEIEAPLNAGYLPTSWLGARDFIQDMAAFVKRESPWLRVTSSAGYGNAVLEITLGFFRGSGLTHMMSMSMLTGASIPA